MPKLAAPQIHAGHALAIGVARGTVHSIERGAGVNVGWPMFAAGHEAAEPKTSRKGLQRSRKEPCACAGQKRDSASSTLSVLYSPLALPECDVAHGGSQPINERVGVASGCTSGPQTPPTWLHVYTLPSKAAQASTFFKIESAENWPNSSSRASHLLRNLTVKSSAYEV